MSRPAAVALVACLLLAGCSGALGPEPATGRAGTTAAAGASATGGTAPADGTPRTGNPWGSDPVVVAVRPADNATYVETVRSATDYWERVDERYLGFVVEYEVRPDAAAPDLVVSFVDEVPDCGGMTDAAGCAPLVRGSVDDRPAVAYVRTGFADASRLLVTKHELGHTLGLGHDDAPGDVMAARSVLYTRPRPNATERAFPWADAEFVVSVDASGAADPAGAREQVGHALDYYEGGAEGTPDNVTFVRTTETTASPEIVVTVGNDGCEGSGSCIRTQGTDPDGDGAIEEYKRLEIAVDGVDTAAVGWHVGYWLAHGFGAEADAEKPPPFRSATYEERRSAWWRT
ncbi:MAG: matrixin [Haloferacaceae archaeon]